MDALLNHVLTGLLQNGVKEGDIAILVGKSKELDHVQSTVSNIHQCSPALHTPGNHIVNSR